MARFTRIEVFQLMEQTKLVPLYFHQDIERVKRVVSACYEGGARVFELTSRGDFAHEVFGELRKYCSAKLPDMALGVGSITDAGSASLYMALGADFVVTPVLREDIAIVCNRRKVFWSPGCGSITDICRAEELGCELIKLFPGDTYGPGMVKAIKGPQPWTSIMPTGGVAPDLDNLQAWFDAGVTCVGMGSKLMSNSVIDAGDFEELAQRVRDTMKLIRAVTER